jgi:pimeloyl-ACP methyl ester carboxylesterase
MFITHNDAELFTVAFGSGTRTLVAFGGWAGSWELWTLPFNELSASWRTIAYDHRGSGASITPAASITVETLVQDVFAVLDAYQVERCVLAAESSGAAIAILAALQQPQRIEGLVLVDGLYYRPAPIGDHPFVLGLKHQFEATIAQFVDACVPKTTGEAIRRWGRQILFRSEQDAAIQLYACMDGVDLRGRLAEVKQPTLIMHGEDDRILPVESSKWLATQIPDCHLQLFAAAGHVPTITHPKEVAEAINHYFA